MTRSVPGLAGAMLGVALMPVVLAQDPQPRKEDAAREQACGDACEPRTLSKVDGTGAITSLVAVKQGEAWRVELFQQRPQKDGNASEQRAVLVFEASDEVNQKIEDLFTNPPEEPAQWAQRIEEAAHVDIAFDFQGPTWYGAESELDSFADIPAELRDRLRVALDEARAQWRREAERGRRGRADWHHRGRGGRGERGDIGWRGRRERGDGCCGDGERRGHGRRVMWGRGRDRDRSTDRVFLANGDVISGELLQADEEGVRVKVASGEVAFERDEVRRIELKQAPRAQLGVTLGADNVARVEEVKDGSAAQRAGLRPGDVITKLDGKYVQDGKHLRKLIREQDVGQPFEITVRRDGQETVIEASLEEPEQDQRTDPISGPQQQQQQPPGEYR